MKKIAALIILYSLAFAVTASSLVFEFETKAQEAQYARITKQLRCLVCQNQSLADSNADLADDLKKKVYAQVLENKTDKEVIDYFVARYGDYVRYEPPFKLLTAFLWFGPSLFLVLAIIVFVVIIRAKQRDEA